MGKCVIVHLCVYTCFHVPHTVVEQVVSLTVTLKLLETSMPGNPIVYACLYVHVCCETDRYCWHQYGDKETRVFSGYLTQRPLYYWPPPLLKMPACDVDGTKQWNSNARAVQHPDYLQRTHTRVILYFIVQKGSRCKSKKFKLIN